MAANMTNGDTNPSKKKDALNPHDKDILKRIFNPSMPYQDIDEDEIETQEENVVLTREEEESRSLEIQGVRKAEQGDLNEALALFDQAITVAPNRASGYNNRAQARQLKMDVQGAFDDLNKAIELSDGRGKVACQAYTQRGILNRVKVSDEVALEDFKKAAALGSDFAKQQAIALNPIAALCNAMMCEMMQKVRSGEMEG